MANSIHAALWEWLSQCGGITKLFFNFFGTSADEPTVISTSGESVLQDYIDGTQLMRYGFDLIRSLPIAFQANDPGNVEMMDDVERIIEWVRQLLPPNAHHLSQRLALLCVTSAVIGFVQ